MNALGLVLEFFGIAFAFSLAWCFLTWAPLLRQAKLPGLKQVGENAVHSSRISRWCAVCAAAPAIVWILVAGDAGAWPVQLLCIVGAVSGSISFRTAGRAVWRWREEQEEAGLKAEKLKAVFQSAGLVAILGLIHWVELL
ncbi:MAG: hypothetical protein HWE35_01190 [Rhodobacteraceae bacterium]|nr:hypothetical protein [Paracoccaceae bacterium]